MTPIKTCACGRSYRLVPPNALKLVKGCELDGYYWNCVCKSTLYLPFYKVKLDSWGFTRDIAAARARHEARTPSP